MRYKILDMLKQGDDYVSGEKIGESLSISRAAVCKNIAKLKGEGYNIRSVSNKGYLLEKSEDILNGYEIGYKNCLYLDKVDSTNEEAKRQAFKGENDGLLIVAGSQQAGKGRLGRSWEDSANKNAVFTVLLKPDISPMEASQLTLVAGLATAETIREATDLDAKIKWPNDIIANGKKIVGILTEMSASMESISYVAVGIGINVNTEKFGEEIEQKAASLYMLTGKRFERADIIGRFMKKFMPMYEAFCKNGFGEFCDKYNAFCINIGMDVRAVQRDKVITGKAVGVDTDGCIKIDTGDGCVKIMCGEVSLRTGDNKYV